MFSISVQSQIHGIVFLKNWNFHFFTKKKQTILHSQTSETMAWEKVQVKGTPPVKRAAHQTAVIEDKIFIFGGYNGAYLDDTHVLDTSTHSSVLFHRREN
jgi:hypothetical protein